MHRRMSLKIRMLAVATAGGLLLGPRFAIAATDRPGQIATEPARVLIELGTKPYTVRSLTGISFHRGLALASRAFRLWGQGRSMFAPGFSPFLGPHFRLGFANAGVSAKRLYYCGLNSVLTAFLVYRAQRQFEAEYRVDLRPFTNLHLFDVAVTKSARATDDYFGIVAEGISKGWTARQFMQHVYRVFPASKPYRNDYLEIWPDIIANKAANYVKVKCFPEWNAARNQPVRWFHFAWYRSFGHLGLEVVIARNPQKYQELADREWGSYRFMRLSGVPALNGERQALRILIEETTETNGHIKANSLRLANFTLAALNSTTRLYPGSATKDMIGGLCGVSAERVGIRRFLPLARGQNGAFNEEYVFIFQTHLMNFSADKILRPGGFVFEAAEKSLLVPIFRKILATAHPMPGLRLPRLDLLLGLYGDGNMASWCLRGTLPKIITAHPAGFK